MIIIFNLIYIHLTDWTYEYIFKIIAIQIYTCTTMKPHPILRVSLLKKHQVIGSIYYLFIIQSKNCQQY